MSGSTRSPVVRRRLDRTQIVNYVRGNTLDRRKLFSIKPRADDSIVFVLSVKSVISHASRYDVKFVSVKSKVNFVFSEFI